MAVRLAVITLVALVAGLSWYFWLRPGPDEPTGQGAAPRLYTIDQDAITAVEVTAGDDHQRIERAQSVWALQGFDGLAVNVERWGGITLLLSGPQIERDLGTVPPGDYGLADPARIAIERREGDPVVVWLGDRTPDGSFLYAQLEGQPNVYLVNYNWGEVLMSLATDPPLPFWYYAVRPAQVRLLEIDSGDEPVTFLLGLSGENPAQGRVVTSQGARDLTEPELEELLALAGGPNELAILEERAEPNSAGLGSPVATVRLTYELVSPLEDRSDYSAVYVIGSPTPTGDHHYVATADTERLLSFDSVWVEDVLTLAESFR